MVPTIKKYTAVLAAGGVKRTHPELAPRTLRQRLQDEEREMTEAGEKIITWKGNMALKSVESQNVEFKSNWRDDASDV